MWIHMVMSMDPQGYGYLAMYVDPQGNGCGSTGQWMWIPPTFSSPSWDTRQGHPCFRKERTTFPPRSWDTRRSHSRRRCGQQAPSLRTLPAHQGCTSTTWPVKVIKVFVNLYPIVDQSTDLFNVWPVARGCLSGPNQDPSR